MDPAAVNEAIEVFGRKWVPVIVRQLRAGAKRHNELAREIDANVSERMLTDTLRDMERDGLVTRSTRATSPPAVVYELTALGRSLGEPFDALASWWHAHGDKVRQARHDADLGRDDVEGP